MAPFDESLICSLESLARQPERYSWHIRHHPDMGRSCFANRDIAAGEILAFDAPLIYWEEDEPVGSPTAKKIIEACSGAIHNNAVNLLAEYADASESLKSRIDDFVSIAPDAAHHISKMTSVWRNLASQIWRNAPDLHLKLKSQENIVSVYTRSHLNAHNFYTGHVMLEIGSKFNHSCTPNATYNKFIADDGRQYMRIFTIKPIPSGTQIFSTYIGGTDMLKSTRDRRLQLSAAKAFVCRCDRCVSPDVLAPLPCPDCRAECMRHDHVETPWLCTGCGLRWWDSQITAREGQIRRLIVNIDAEMSLGRFPPLQIVKFVVRDALEDLGRRHYLAVQGRLLLEELYAFREITGILEDEEEASRLANGWVYVAFLMRVVWKISPVVATNLSVLRLRTLLGKHGRFPPGVPRHQLRKVLVRSESFLRLFWGPDDEDAAFFRAALEDETKCGRCKVTLESIVVCGSCASAHYCSRQCQVEDRKAHSEQCEMAKQVSSTLNSSLAF